jgi:hypothetical protein
MLLSRGPCRLPAVGSNPRCYPSTSVEIRHPGTGDVDCMELRLNGLVVQAHLHVVCTVSPKHRVAGVGMIHRRGYEMQTWVQETWPTITFQQAQHAS